jgi:hypothetical protein
VPEDEVVDARLIITNAGGSRILYNQRLVDSSDNDCLTFSPQLNTGLINIYLFANELTAWNLDAVSSSAEITDKMVALAWPEPQVDATHPIPMFRKWEGIQLNANGTTTLNGVTLDFSAAGIAGKIERLWAKVEIASISASFADIGGIAITLDSLRLLHLPAEEYLAGRTYAGTAYYTGKSVAAIQGTNYNQTATGFTGGPYVMYAPEHRPKTKADCSYVELYCHLTADAATAFTYRINIGNGLSGGFMPDYNTKTIAELTISRNTCYRLTISQIKGFGTLESATIFASIEPWTQISQEAIIDPNEMHLSGIKKSYSDCQLERGDTWIINWETNHEPRYIWYSDACINPPGSGTQYFWADKDTVAIAMPTCDFRLTLMAPEMLYTADNITWDTLQVADWFIPTFSDNATPDDNGFWRGSIKLTPKPSTDTPTPWPITGTYHLYAGDEHIRARELEMEMDDCPTEPLIPGEIFYDGLCYRIVTKVEENGPYAEINGDLPSGGNGNYTYQWEYSLNDYNYTPVPSGGDGQYYTPGTEIAYGIHYRRKVTDGQGEFGYSNTVQIFLVTLTTTPEITINSNRGRDFWLAFGVNYDEYWMTSNDVTLQLKIAAEAATQVTLTFPNDPTCNEVISIAAGDVQTIDLTTAQKVAVYNTESGITTKSLHITSDADIIVYAINLYQYTTDATAVYPVGSLGKEYYHMGYTPISFDSYSRDGFIVVAVENNTHVYENAINGTLLATLNAGEVFTYFGQYSVEELVGMHIVTDKPVAYFVNTTICFVPYDYWAGDILFEQLFSVDRWGEHFFVPQTEQGIIRVRVMAAMNGTTVSGTNFTVITGSTSLNAGEWFELECANIAGCSVHADKPIMVCAYLVGDDYEINNVTGDPAMGWIPPIEQKTRDVMASRFIAPGSALNNHYAFIITSTDGKDNTTIAVGNGVPAPISGVTWYDNADVGLSFCSYNLPDDNFYRFDNPNGVVVGGYGFGAYESYFYLGAAASRVLSPAMKINGYYSDEVIGMTFGNCNQITFECSSSSPPSSITWTLNGELQPGHTHQAIWSENLPVGDYIARMDVIINEELFTYVTWFRVRCCVADD